MGAPLQWNTRTRFYSALIVARISCSQRVNSCFSTTSSSRTSPNAARTARASAWPCLDPRHRTGRRAGIPTRGRRPGRTVRNAGKKPRCRSGRRKDVRYCAASAFSRGDRSPAPDFPSILSQRGQQDAHPAWRPVSCALETALRWRSCWSAWRTSRAST